MSLLKRSSRCRSGGAGVPLVMVPLFAD